MAQTTFPKKPRESDLPGVSGEFHTQGALKLAARTAQREGIPAERIWYLGEPATDRLGDLTGVVMPASLPREAALAGLVLGGLAGALFAFFLPPQTLLAGLLRLVPRVVLMGLLGTVVGSLAGWASISGRLGGYLASVRAGSLRLKITLPPNATPEETEREAERAERALRLAKAETLIKLDGSVEINSPQSPSYVA